MFWLQSIEPHDRKEILNKYTQDRRKWIWKISQMAKIHIHKRQTNRVWKISQMGAEEFTFSNSPVEIYNLLKRVILVLLEKANLPDFFLEKLLWRRKPHRMINYIRMLMNFMSTHWIVVKVSFNLKHLPKLKDKIKNVQKILGAEISHKFL